LPITEQHTQECLSIAHIQAIAGAAGYIAECQPPLDYGVDGHFHSVRRRGNRLVAEGFPLDFQLKATINWQREGDYIVYDLDATAFNDIVTRSPAETTLILILLCLPEDRDKWLRIDNGVSELRNCCYWHIPDGPETTNTSKRRVRIPADQVLTPATLEELMEEERDRRIAQQ
jgi:hypothetical protein